MKIQTWIYSNTVVFPAHWWRGVVFVKTFADDSLLRLWCSINTDSSIDIFLATPSQEASTTETTSHQWGGEQTIRRPQGHTWTLTTVFSHTHTDTSAVAMPLPRTWPPRTAPVLFLSPTDDPHPSPSWSRLENTSTLNQTHQQNKVTDQDKPWRNLNSLQLQTDTTDNQAGPPYQHCLTYRGY